MKVILLSLLAAWFTLPVLRAEEISVLVNEHNQVNEISEEQLSNFFLKKNRQWPNGVPVRFFDKKDDSELRNLFLSEVVKKTAREVELYWIGQKLYTGNSAPLQLSTDQMTASMVAKFPGAIGYVASSFQNAPGVKKIALKKE